MTEKGSDNHSFIDDLLDVETYSLAPEKNWPSIKLIFDNLRCYPILALISFAMIGLAKADGIFFKIAFYFLIPWLLFISIALVVQTGIVLALTTVGLFTSIFGISAKPHAIVEFTRKQKTWVRVITPIFVAAFIIFCTSAFLAMSAFFPSIAQG